MTTNAMIEKFLIDRRKRGDELWCPEQRATISRQECAARHLRDHSSRWFGRESDALATPQDRKCNECGMGRLQARKLGTHSAIGPRPPRQRFRAESHLPGNARGPHSEE